MEVTLEVRAPRLGQERIHAPGVQWNVYTVSTSSQSGSEDTCEGRRAAGSDGGEAELLSSCDRLQLSDPQKELGLGCNPVA